jgi:glycosyltransferase involved in cell wall biosynthesis
MYLATRLDPSRFDVSVICSTVRNPSFIADIEVLLQRGVQVKVIAMKRDIRPFSDIVAFFRIYRFLRKGSFDIVHTHSSKAGFPGRIAARLAGVPAVLYTPHAFSFYRGLLGTKRLYPLLERFAAHLTDTVIAVSDGERDIALKYAVTGGDGVITIKNWVDLSEFPDDIETGNLKNELGLEGASSIVGTVGRICAQKGYGYFIEAAVEVAKSRPDVRFVLVCDGNLDKALAEIDRCEARDVVMLTGQRTDVTVLYALFDVVVVPSLWEGLPYVVLEAMAMRKPVIATGIPGNAEVVFHGETGYIVPPGDAKAMADAIEDLLDALSESGVDG